MSRLTLFEFECQARVGHDPNAANEKNIYLFIYLYLYLFIYAHTHCDYGIVHYLIPRSLSQFRGLG